MQVGATSILRLHPGIALDDPHPETGEVPVAMVSSKLRFGAPGLPVEKIYKGGLYGNIRLDPPKYTKDPKHWEGGQLPPMTHDELTTLKAEMGEQFTSRSSICCLFINICSDKKKQRVALPSSV
jgi:hypothetical protein